MVVSCRCPEASSAQNSMAADSADGTVCVLIRRLNSSCSLSMALVVRTLFHWLGGRRVKANSASPASFQAVGDGAMLEAPFADERLAARLDLLAGRCVDHVGVIGGDLLVQALGRVGEQIAMLVHGATLNRRAVPHGGDRLVEAGRAIDNEELEDAVTCHGRKPL